MPSVLFPSPAPLPWLVVSPSTERPKNELQDPLEGQLKQSKQSKAGATENGPGSKAGGLLHLIDTTDQREAERRRFEKEKSEARYRRPHASLADPRDRIEVEDLLRRQAHQQQRPQQDSAEEPAKVVTMRRSETMPVVPDGRLPTSTVTGVSRKDKRPPTPSANPPRRVSHPVVCGSTGFKQMSPSTTPGRADDRGSPHTPKTAYDSSPGSHVSYPSPGVLLPVTNPYGGSSLTNNTDTNKNNNTKGNTPAFAAASSGAKMARGGAGLEHRGRSSSPGFAKVITPSKGSKGSKGSNGRTATPRKTPSPVVMVSASSPATVRGSSPVMRRGHVHGVSGAAGGGAKAAQGTTPPGKDGGPRGGREGAAVVRFEER